MPSPIAHCKQSVILLVVSLFLLGCVVPSSVDSTVDIRTRRKNNVLPMHNRAKGKKEKEKEKEKTWLDYAPMPLPGLPHTMGARN